MNAPAPPAGLFFTPAALARSARAELEYALGPKVESWPWSARLSHLLDMYVLLEEQGDDGRTVLGSWWRPI